VAAGHGEDWVLGVRPVREVVLGSRTGLQGQTMSVEPEELKALACEDPRIGSVVVDLAHPGLPHRLVNILDVVEPRSPADGSPAFPGVLGSVMGGGRGEVAVLESVAVMSSGLIPGVQGGLIEMGGEGALFSPFSRLWGIVLTFTSAPGLPARETEEAFRLATLKIAAHMARTATSQAPVRMESLHPPDDRPTGDLPRLAAVIPLQAQGVLRETFVFGLSAEGILPTALHPGWFDAGGVTSGNYVVPANRTPTYVYQNHPVIRALRRGHGATHRFVGVAVACEPSSLEGKRRSARHAGYILKSLHAHGAVVTREGGGNTDTDLMLLAEALEDAGIRAVLVANELAGSDGTQPSLTDFNSRADAMISTGNNDYRVRIGPADRLMGALPFEPLGPAPLEGGEAPLALFLASTSPQGFHTLRCMTR